MGGNRKVSTRIPATYLGERGAVVQRQDRVVWWQGTADTELVMFSRRQDGVWRAFPGPADGPGLKVARK